VLFLRVGRIKDDIFRAFGQSSLSKKGFSEGVIVVAGWNPHDTDPSRAIDYLFIVAH
jgi:hypothetical protein